MARPEEKANAMMNKWVAMKDAGNAPKIQRQRRPFMASECSNLEEAERWRRQLIKEISDLISKIQNPGLGEHAIRDMNDDINKKMREKHHWNLRIKELGGPNFVEIERKQQLENISDQTEVMGTAGYKYFGAAKDLPGVKEVFLRAQKQRMSKRKRADLYKTITPDYYGWRDEEDGVLLELEREVMTEAEKILQEKRNEYRRMKAERGEDPTEEESDEEDGGAEIGQFEIPSQEMVAEAILEQKKRALLERLRYS
jgi:pre-mRNA-splicing factor ISY1